MDGQSQRLKLPDAEPLASIDAEIEEFSRRLFHKGVSGFVLAFNYRHKGMMFHSACLDQNSNEPALQTITPALDSVAALNDLLFVTDERNRLAQPRRYCAPTLLANLPENPPRHNPPHELNLAYEYLADLDLPAGWEHFRRRNDPPVTEVGEHIRGEQGIGDDLFFMRWLRLSPHPIHYYANAKLLPLLQQCTRWAFEISFNDKKQAPRDSMQVGELPQLLEAENVMPPLPLYLHDVHIKHAAKVLHSYGPPPYTLITWRAGTPPVKQTHGALWAAYKSAPLEPFSKLLRDLPGTVISIQRNTDYHELEILETESERNIIDLDEINNDLIAMTALLSVADNYIGVSNTNMHLRAGLYKPAHVLLPYPAAWQYTRTLDVSPWFPTFKLYRQNRYGDWTAAFEKLAEDLQHETA